MLCICAIREHSGIVLLTLPKILIIYLDGKESSPKLYPIAVDFQINMNEFYKGNNTVQSTMYGKVIV